MSRALGLASLVAPVLAIGLVGCVTPAPLPDTAHSNDWSGDLRMAPDIPLVASLVRPISLDERDRDKVVAALALDPGLARDIAGVRLSADGRSLELFEAPRPTAYPGICLMWVMRVVNDTDGASAASPPRAIKPIALRPANYYTPETAKPRDCAAVPAEEFRVRGPSEAIVHRAFAQVDRARELVLARKVPLFDESARSDLPRDLQWAQRPQAIEAASSECRGRLQGLGGGQCWGVTYALDPKDLSTSAWVIVAGRDPIAGVSISRP